MWPRKFNNKTNGVTQRRWLAHCNPGLRDLINEAIGDQWETDLAKIEALLPFAGDEQFRERWRRGSSSRTSDDWLSALKIQRA